MRIDPDVATAAKHWAGESQAFARLIQAVVNAEGNIVKAVSLSVPSVTTRHEALEITCRSAAHALADWVSQSRNDQASFVDFWADRWAPQGVANDPHGLNANWPTNVKAAWLVV